MLSITLRTVSEADSSLLLSWRNDPDVRRVSGNSDIVAWPEHDDWLKRGLRSADRIMKIAEVDGEAVGVVRADRNDDGWRLSWTVAPKARGRGIGGAMLRCFVHQLEGRLVALIRCDNRASLRIASAAGMIRVEGGDEGEFQKWGRDGKQRDV